MDIDPAATPERAVVGQQPRADAHLPVPQEWNTAPQSVPELVHSAPPAEGGSTSAPSSSPLPATPQRRASITFKLKSYNDTPEFSKVADQSGLLAPYWAGARLSRAPSPALSVQSDASERGSGSKNNGTRPATFLFTLTSFLRDNPNSPYMRWSESGTYFIVPDKSGLMERVIPDLFNQNSYSSFARQLNIYGWRRLQSSPDGKVTNSNCTIWKHDQITRDTPDEDLKHVKRNAQDKSRRNNKGMDDDGEEEEVTVTRPRRAVTMSSTTAAEAMAARNAVTATTNLRYSSTTFGSNTASSTAQSNQVPSVLAPAPNPSHGPSPAAVLQAAQPPTFIQGRLSRPLPMRRPPSKSFSYSGRSITNTTRARSPESAKSHSSDSSNSTASDDTFAVPAAPAEGRATKKARHDLAPDALGQNIAHRAIGNGETALRVLPFQLAASRQVTPQNPIDVYVACLENVNAGPPTFKGRDRIDVPIWVDDFSQARFVLAGEMMRAWALWDIVPPESLLYIALSDSSKPPRPLGIAQQLKDNTANGDPNRAYSRERIYLEASGEPGSVGQCCLIVRQLATAEGETEVATARKNVNTSMFTNASSFPAKVHSEIQQSNGHPIPPTPKILQQAPTSSERGPLLCETRSGRKPSDRFLDSPGLPSPAMQTPKTADAISSLAAMQALARSFNSTKDMSDSKSPVRSSIDSSVPRSVTHTSDVDMKPVVQKDSHIPSLHTGGGSS